MENMSFLVDNHERTRSRKYKGIESVKLKIFIGLPPQSAVCRGPLETYLYTSLGGPFV